MKLCWIGTPTRDGKVHARMMNGINQLQIMAATGKSRGWSFGYDCTQGSPNIPSQRNWAVAKAEQKGAQAVLFVDSDIEFEPEHVLDLLDRDEEVIGIAHQTRPRTWTDAPNMSGHYTRADNPKRPVFDLEQDFLKARKLTTGFLLVKMSVFRKIREAGLVQQFVANVVPEECWPYLHNYFMHKINETRPLPDMQEKLAKAGLPTNTAHAFDGEDWDFNVRCEKAGVDMWIEPLGSLNHYEGSMAMDLDLHKFWTLYETDFREEYLAWLAARAKRCPRARKRMWEVGQYALAS